MLREHPLPYPIESFVLGAGGLTVSGARTKRIEIGRPLAETDEVRRIYLRVVNPTFTAVGETAFRFATVQERDAFWTALFPSLDLKVEGCRQPIQAYSGGHVAQIYRGMQYEGMVTDIPPPAQALTLPVVGEFSPGDLYFEVPYVFDGVEALDAYGAPQAWQITNGNGLQITRGPLSFSASGVTWTMDTSAGVALQVWVEKRPNPVKMARPLPGLRVDEVQQSDNFRVPVNGPVLWCGVLDRSPNSFADTFDITIADQGGANCAGLLKSDWAHSLRVVQYHRDMSHGSQFMHRDAPTENGIKLGDLQPTNLFWTKPGATVFLLDDIKSDLMLRNIGSADLSAGITIASLSMIPVGGKYQGGSVQPPPAQAQADQDSLPKTFTGGPYAARVLGG